ncbi:MAG: hypothetical protein EOL89_01215 [Actinobacteria bacterium]|nr:hypothetical protein [Actinomycetota bacterium]
MLITLVLEHIASSSTPDWRRISMWIAGSAVSLLLLLATRSWERRLDDKAGTLYYLRLLAPWMPNWHEGSLRTAEQEYLRIQPLSRDLDVSPTDGVIDVRVPVASVSDKLEERLAADDRATGVAVAPDILAPAAYALASKAVLPRGSRLLDFGNPEFAWQLGEAGKPPESRPGFLDVTPVRSEFDGRAGIHVHAALTGEPDFAPLPLRVQTRTVVGVVRDGVPQKVTVSTTPHQGHVHPAVAATAWNEAVRAALHESRDTPVVITSRVPKTVSFAAGYLLSPAHRRPGTARSLDPGCGLEGCSNDACLHPWRYLLPLNYNQRSGTWEPIWLLSEQRDPRELLALLEAAQ